MNVRFLKTASGRTFVVYEVRNMGTQVGCPIWNVFCGLLGKRPQWRPLITRMRGRPYFWVEGTKLYLDEFKKTA